MRYSGPDWTALRQDAVDVESEVAPPTPPEKMTLEELRRLPVADLEALVCRGQVPARQHLLMLQALEEVRQQREPWRPGAVPFDEATFRCD